MNENERETEGLNTEKLNKEVLNTNDSNTSDLNKDGFNKDSFDRELNTATASADDIVVNDEIKSALTTDHVIDGGEYVNQANNGKKRTSTAYKRTIALGLAGTILCGASLGLSLGVGLNVSKNLFSGGLGNFSFAKDTNENATINASATGVDLTPSEDSVAKVFNSVKDSVVNISITVQSSSFFNQTYESTGSGSGIIYSQDDEKVFIVTNNHVVDGASSVEISITGTEQVAASLVGKDASSDLAVISVLKTDLQAAGISSVTPAVFADSDDLEVGEFVIAIGNALGQGKTATRGIVSAVNKEINIDGKKLTVLQTDAAINPGNSGGALVNTEGKVVGINTAKLSSSSVEGMGYSIPTTVAKTVIEELMKTGTVDKPYLGIQVYTINDQFKRIYNINTDGVFISGIEDSSAAEKAGLQVTDIIVAVNGTKVTTGDELSSELSKYKSGDKVTLSIIRNGNTSMTVTATLTNQNEKF